MKNQSGFTLLEFIVSMGILSFAISGFLSSSISMSKMLSNGDIQSKAILVAQEVLDEVRLYDLKSLTTTNHSDSAINITIDGVTLSAIVTYCKNSTFCPPTSSNDVRHINVDVYFQGKKVYDIETVYTKFI